MIDVHGTKYELEAVDPSALAVGDCVHYMGEIYTVSSIDYAPGMIGIQRHYDSSHGGVQCYNVDGKLLSKATAI